MPLSIATHAHRKLRRLTRYVSVTPLTVVPYSAFLTPDEGEIVGYYRNNGDAVLVFTTTGVIVPKDGLARFVPYAEMADVWPAEADDANEDALHVVLRSRARVTLPVQGRHGLLGTHDKYLVRMFLQSAMAAALPSAPVAPF